MHKVINLFAGPGTGKSTTCAALFAELKYRGVNTEMVLEYAKSAAWEGRLSASKIENGVYTPPSKIAKAQEYIFGKQSFGLSRVADEVAFTITDAPLLLGLVYMPTEFGMPSLRQTIREAHRQYDNLNVFLVRNKPYNPKGRVQDEEGAKELDTKIREMLLMNDSFHILQFDRENVTQIIDLMYLKGWLQ
jgi:hypothetical protein